MRWHPPIPANKLYSKPALDLGPALAMLIWCYDGIQRDGTIEISIEQAAHEIGKPYRTVKEWWRQLRTGPFFSEMEDHGRSGWVVRLDDDWIDWRIMQHNYPTDEGQNVALESESKPSQSPLKARSRTAQGQDTALETSAYKVLMDDQESRGSTRAKRAPTTPHKHEPKKERDTTLDHPAVVIYRDTFKSTPNAEYRRAIAMAVTHIELWSDVSKLWKTNRWDYLKVENLISRYQKNGHSNGKSIRQGAGPDFERARWSEGTDDEPA